MIRLSDRIPAYFLGKFQLVSTVVFTALFSIVFMLVSIPFSHNAWFELGPSHVFGYTLLFFVVAFLFVCLSKFVMYKVNLPLTFFQYIIWNVAEVILLCALYTSFSLGADSRGLIDLKVSTATLFLNSLLYCFTSLAVPYIISAMYFAIQDKDNTIRMINYGNVVSDETMTPQREQVFTLFDNNGVLKLSISAANLFYIESDDNYIIVWYTDNKQILKQYMLRCRLKTVEDSFHDTDLVRCHRKYIVNISKVQVLSKEKECYTLNLGNDAIDPIPVSKTYEESVLARFYAR